MDSWVVGQVSFWYTVSEIKPAAIVDRAIQFWLDLVTPGRGTGESSWWMRSLRSLEQTSDRTRLEFDVRRELRNWDQQHPEIHHEMLVRWVCGAVVSVAVTGFYNSLRRGGGSGSSSSPGNFRRY